MGNNDDFVSMHEVTRTTTTTLLIDYRSSCNCRPTWLCRQKTNATNRAIKNDSTCTTYSIDKETKERSWPTKTTDDYGKLKGQRLSKRC
mmetsp:Transcript_31055/g.47572  ORF Transcript_31055/g.47572 Transcript_31055/m.47572 type:complete len:89 (+) Transcript_31055:126-392(+)